MISQNGQLDESGDLERRGDTPGLLRDVERSGEASDSVPVAGVEAQPRKRRKLGRTEQLRLLREYEALPNGQKGLFLRRLGFYTAQISAWRKIRDDKFLKDAPKRGRKAKEENPLAKELALKERQLQKALKRLAMLEQVIEIQKKISEITGIPLKVINIDELD